MSNQAAITKATDLKRQAAWDMHLNGVDQITIAAELGVTQARVSQYIKQVAAAHPVNKLSLQERMALSEARWQMSETEIRKEINRQRLEGRTVTRTTTMPNGQKQTEVTHDRSIDPALLRALSTHHDRRNRHALNQASPDQAVNQVQVNVLKDFLDQGNGGNQALSASEWNARQGSLDV